MREEAFRRPGLWERLWGATNHLWYWLRHRLAWSKPGYLDPPEPKDALYAELDGPDRAAAEARAADLAASYGLADYAASSSREIYKENLYLLDLLERMWDAGALPRPPAPEVLDIGPKNWFYARALHHFFRTFGGEPALTGVEIDAYRVYEDLHSRYDYAQAFTAGIPRCRYLVGDALAHRGSYDIVLMLFPFLTPRPLLLWGLPLDLLKPRELLHHAWSLLRPGGVLVILNQGPDEAQLQRQLLAGLGAQPAFDQAWDSLLYDYPHPRHAWAVIKPAG